jgi:hypothetical protein
MMRRNGLSNWRTRLAVAVTLLAVVRTAAGAAQTIFFDDFNRPDGGLDVLNWSDSSAAIVGERMCGDVQSFGLYAHPITGKHVRVSYEFSASDPSGFETYVVAQAGSQTFITGCDGGFGAACTPKIARDMINLVTGTAIPMETGKLYRIEGEIEEGVLTLKISDPSIPDACSAVLATLGMDTDTRFTEIGLVVGRKADGMLTCADDFRVEDLGP